jgi:hypothetical protein
VCPGPRRDRRHYRVNISVPHRQLPSHPSR